ncbi:MAG: adenosylhomocysteinase, adenosylhomocysteinase [Candidatus Peregrinibacteria bacterium GW2011_GWC2_39_14]|nr:MAG: Adenosylhomocysteinase [Candidatus Peregrinibacteria bacterium GW2011_GWA2_38_36]KKR05232.1 MAG: adenosylhomocysteinase, adenosylhomocysteinase [Candidatus Peregrinibacteria bacterium GW2011_GWC2_39_14]
MDKGKTFEVCSLSLADQGKLNADFARQNMGSLMKIKERFAKERPLEGLKIGMALHVTKETAMLVETLQAGGAKIFITGCNPLSTQDDVAAYLAKEGVNVYAYKGETREDYYRYLGYVIEGEPDITIDDGCDLVSEIHKNHKELLPKLIGGTEETTTGVIRLRAMERDKALEYPVVAVNDNKTKHLVDNYYGTGQSTLDGIIRASNILFAGKTVVIVGYGDCGKGASMRAKGLGANVVVCEVDHFKALQAYFDGFRVMKMEDACKLGDIFITVTGDIHVIAKEHFSEMKNGAIMANSGHFDCEIDIKELEKAATKKCRIRPYLDEYTLKNGRVIYLAGEGRLINLAAAEGHPSEVMGLSFCGQALACEFLAKNRGKLESKVHTLPVSIDDDIAKIALASFDVKIDKLTAEQVKYLNSWEEGT